MSGWNPELRGDALEGIRGLIVAENEGSNAAGLAIDGIDFGNADLRSSARSMRETHERHLDNLTAILADKGLSWPTDPGRPVSVLLRESFTAVATIFGTRASLRALQRVELRLRDLYEAASAVGGVPDNVLDVIDQGLDDQRRHTGFLARVLRSLDGPLTEA